MNKEVYKRYKEMVKFVIDYDKLNILQKIVFNIMAPKKFKTFKKKFKYEYELLLKSIKKEGNKNDK